MSSDSCLTIHEEGNVKRVFRILLFDLLQKPRELVACWYMEIIEREK